jgi:membrane protein
MINRRRFQKASVFLKHDIWKISRDELTPLRAFLIRQLQIFIIALRGLNENNIYLRASSLTFFTLLSIVPIVALAIGIATGFGLEEYLLAQLEQAFTGRQEVLEFILGFSGSLLETTQGGIMAGVGLGILFFTIMKVLNHIEESFNEIWQIKKERSFSRKFTDYFAIMLIGPFFLILSNIVTVFLTTQIEALTLQTRLFGFFSPVILTLLGFIPFFLLWLMLTLLYIVMPNTRVRFGSALVAGIVAGTVFQMVQWGYIYFQLGVSKYGAIYGSFAALPLLMFWMQISWVIVLFGAELSFANQNIEQYEYETESLNMSLYNRRLITFYIAHLLIKNFENGVPPCTSSQISQNLHIPIRLVKGIVEDLVAINLLSETKTKFAKETAYQPATDINKITVKYLSDKLDHRGMNVLFAKESAEIKRIIGIMDSFNRDIEKNPENKLLKDI